MIDVLIIGAGPSGLMMALECLRHGLTCRLIDKNRFASNQSKALAVQARTLEVFDYIGVTEECVAQGIKVDKVMPTRCGKPICTLSFRNLDSPYPFVLSLEQSKLEHILIQKLQTMEGGVQRETELLHFQQNEQEVVATLYNHATGVQEICTSRWIVGGDGAHSTVRKQLGLEFEGFSFPQILSLVDLEIEWKYPRDRLIGFVEPESLLFAIPIHEKNRYRLVFQLDRGIDFIKANPQIKLGEVSEKTLQRPTMEEVTTLVHRCADSQAILKNPVWMTNFSINSRMVSHYQKKNAFLIGDAAHIHSPVGGQGMNTGLQDAFNLAWKLAFVKKGFSPVSLINSYQDERYFVGKRLLNGTEKATKVILTRHPILFFLRNALMSFLMSFQTIQKKVTATISEINVFYPMSRWNVQKGSSKLQAGARAPHILPLVKNTISYHLLVNDKADFKSFETEYLKVHSLPDMQSPYEKGKLYLIRPDGYVAYCGPASDPQSLKDYCKNFIIPD